MLGVLPTSSIASVLPKLRLRMFAYIPYPISLCLLAEVCWNIGPVSPEYRNNYIDRPGHPNEVVCFSDDLLTLSEVRKGAGVQMVQRAWDPKWSQ
jgi:hypothetical protein